MPECFTCINKRERPLTSEEISKLRKEQFEKTGVMKPISTIEFTCLISGKIIKQDDNACSNHVDLF